MLFQWTSNDHHSWWNRNRKCQKLKSADENNQLSLIWSRKFNKGHYLIICLWRWNQLKSSKSMGKSIPPTLNQSHLPIIVEEMWLLADFARTLALLYRGCPFPFFPFNFVEYDWSVQVPGAPDLAGDPGRPVDGRAAHAQEPHLQDHPRPPLPALHRQARVQDEGGARAHAADGGGAASEMNVHCASSPQLQYFLKLCWHVPPAVGLILQLLCSPTGKLNFCQKTKQNKTSGLRDETQGV